MKTIADRLNWALDTLAPSEIRGDRKALQLQMKSRMKGSREGTSYPAVLGYFADKVSPSVEWLEAAARLLGVRSAWLIVGHGAPTEVEENRRVHKSNRDPEEVARTRRAALDAFFDEASGLHLIGLEIGNMVLQAVSDTARWIGPEGLNLADLEDEEGDQEGHRRHVEAARLLGRAMMAPLEILHIEPASWPNGAKAQYLAHALPTLGTLAELEHGLAADLRAYVEQPESSEGDDDA